MDEQGDGRTTGTQGFDNPAFDRKQGEKSAVQKPVNGEPPAPAVYNQSDTINADELPPKGGVSVESPDDVEQKKQEKRDRKPLKFIEFIVNHTGACFGVTLAGHVILLLITAVLFQIGYDIVPMSFDRLPLEIRDDVDYLRELAWLEKNTEDNKIIEWGAGGINSVQDERTIIYEQIDMLFEKQGGNVFTQENLKAMKEVEDSFMDNEIFKNEYCLLSGSPQTCSKPNSVIRFFDGTYAGLGLAADPEFTNIPHYINTVKSVPSLRSMLILFLGKDAVVSATKAESSITRSMLPIGGPLAGYSNTSHDSEAQDELYKEFLVDNFKPLADGYFNDKVGPNKLDFYYLSTTMFVVSILKQVQLDMVLAVGSFCFIAIFILIQTGSLFVTFFAIFSIITCFLGTNLVYRCILDFRYFGIFHVLALFIILGIGADDIFVFLDSWKGSAHNNYKSLAHRMSDVYRKASVAMFYTSLTTGIAFFVSAGSPFLAISSFGVFSGILIFVNYISVIIFFPCVVLMYHRYFEKYRCCCCCPRPVASNAVSGDGNNDSEGQPAPGQLKKNPIVRFFRGPYFKLVTHKVARWIILVIFAAILGVFLYFATQLKVNEDQIKFFKETTNVGKYLDRNANAFEPLGNDRLAKVYIVFGLNEQDLSTCHHTDPKCMGETVWNNKFNLDSAQAQSDILTMCNALKNMGDETADGLRIKRSLEDDTTLEVACFLDDMKDAEMTRAGGYPDYPYNSGDWTQLKTHRPDVYTDTSFTTDFSQHFSLSLGYWMYDEFNGTNSWRNKYSKYIGEVEDEANTKTRTFTYPQGHSETISYGNRLRYVAIVVNTTVSAISMGYGEGLEVRDKWEEWITAKLDAMAAKDQLGGFQTTGGLWHWLKVQKKLVSGAVLGIIVGLCVALPILIIATHNILVGLLATIVIACVTVSVIGVIPLAGWKLGLLESLNLVLVVGLSVDYVVHLAEGYSRSPHNDRKSRVRDSLEEVGISVLSGACTTLGASMFLLFAIILFFTQFGIFMFSTIGFSITYALGLFITLLGLIGPEGDTGSLKPLYRKIGACCKRKSQKS